MKTKIFHCNVTAILESVQRAQRYGQVSFENNLVVNRQECVTMAMRAINDENQVGQLVRHLIAPLEWRACVIVFFWSAGMFLGKK